MTLVRALPSPPSEETTTETPQALPLTISHEEPHPALPSTSNYNDIADSNDHDVPASSMRRISFEELLLEQVKQAARVMRRIKIIYGGAEVITSEEAFLKLKENE